MDLSFNPESWVIAMYGFEGEDFEWENEPYYSRIEQTPEQYLHAFMNQGTMALHTNIYDGKAGTLKYSLGNNALTGFAESMEGKRMLIKPTRHDPFGDFAEETNALNDMYWDNILQAIQGFYIQAIKGEIDIDAAWDAYVEDLYANGLQEYIDLMAKFAEVE
jgi:hypothetical protein